MQTVKINLKENPENAAYNLYVGTGILESVFTLHNPDNYTSFGLVVDENLKDFPWFKNFIKIIKDNTESDPLIFFIPQGEKSKNIETVSALWSGFQKAGLDRKSLLFSVGGGAACDLNGFAASTYMRGIDFVHVPTTLLAQVDASIGGKTGINFSEIKNLIGTFRQPAAVIIDCAVLNTLPERELNAGFAEVIKHGLIQDEKYYHKIRSSFSKKNEPRFLEEIICGSCQIKARVVEKDAAEGGLRKILNFGHTFGHAVESLSHRYPKPYLHGEAISIGMVAEAKLSEFLGFITHKQVLEIEETLKNYNLPARLDFKAEFEDIITKIHSDKKNSKSKVNWSLLEKIGKANFDQQASQEQVKEALQYINS